jgi:Protein of unknown function (DUF3631)
MIGALILEDIVRFLRRFVVLSEAQADAITLWIAHTYVLAAFDTTPYLWIVSAEKRSGKTRLLEVLELLVCSPLPTANISDSALFRAIAELKPTLLFDEVDAIFGARAREREDLRGLLNAGYRRGAVARRMGGPRMTTLQAFPVFCAKALAGLGTLPDTITDRAIRIGLERKTREEQIERFRRREVGAEAEFLSERVADWVEPQADELRVARPQLPDELDDRAQDIWEPLLAIAELAGGDWPPQAHAAALELSTGETREDDSLTARLLRDVYAVFESSGRDRFKTSDLIDELCKIEESPWGDWYGKAISPQGLSNLLRPYRIKTMTIRGPRQTTAHQDGKPVRGYKREQFTNAFLRVLGVTGVTAVTPGSAPGAGCNARNACNAQVPPVESAWTLLGELLTEGVDEREARVIARAIAEEDQK